MFDDDTVAAVLERVRPSSFRGHLYRIISEEYRGDPLSGIGSVVDGGRYNSAGAKMEAFYASDSRVTALREVGALSDDREEPRSPDLILTIDVALERILVLDDPTLMADLGTDHDELLAPWLEDQIAGVEAATQRLGRLIFASKRFAAIRAPSAARENASNTVIFPARFTAAESVSIYDPRRRWKQSRIGAPE